MDTVVIKKSVRKRVVKFRVVVLPYTLELRLEVVDGFSSNGSIIQRVPSLRYSCLAARQHVRALSESRECARRWLNGVRMPYGARSCGLDED